VYEVAADIPGSNGRKDRTLVREAKPLSSHWAIASMLKRLSADIRRSLDGKENGNQLNVSRMLDS
jgi:hypothetical protein